MIYLGLLLILVFGIGWGLRHRSQPSSDSTPLSLAMMLTCVIGLLAVAAYYSEDNSYGCVVAMLVPFALWTAGGWALALFDQKVFEGSVITSFLVEFAVLLMHVVAVPVVLAWTVGSFLASAMIGVVWKASRGGRVSARR